ncbi:MAG: type II toxin-antitoxin system RelE family toxin [Eggerthella lenta]
MGYSVELTSGAAKQLQSLDRKTLLLVSELIERLDGCENPCMLPNAKKLQGVKNGWRWRSGTYRVLGTVDGSLITIEVFKIGHRRDVYRGL